MYDLRRTAERKQGQSHITWIINTRPVKSVCHQVCHIRNGHIHARKILDVIPIRNIFFNYTPDYKQQSELHPFLAYLFLFSYKIKILAV